MSVKSRHLLLLLYKISFPIYAFLPALQNLKDASAVQVRSSSSQPASHGFMDCLVSLVVVTSQVIFQGPEQVVVWGRPNPDCGVDGRAVPSRYFELSARSDVQCEASRSHVEGWQFSSSDVFHEAHDEVCWASKRNDLNWSCPVFLKRPPVCIPYYPKRQFP
jgi:hypothetical protein